MDNNFYTKDCPGHKAPLDENCINCQKDYDLRHYPNNYDCPLLSVIFYYRRNNDKGIIQKRKNIRPGNN